jgi:hypothetical protein
MQLLRKLGDAYEILIRKPDRKRPLRRPMHKWEDRIRMDLMEIGLVWTGFIWLRITVVNFWVLQKLGDFLITFYFLAE